MSSTKNKHLVLVAGEASGDLLAAHLVEEIKQLDPSITFSGIGGEKLSALGVELYDDLTRKAVVGFWEVVKNFAQIKKVFDRLVVKIKEIRPSAVILIDYPGFNLRLAKVLHQAGIKVIYYVSPQVWAWKASRVEQIRKFTDRLLVLFEFEKDFYARRGLTVEFVGHPLLESVKPIHSRDDIVEGLDLSPTKTTIGLLPGSREKEIDLHLPIMLETAAILFKKNQDLQFLLIKAPTISLAILRQHLTQHDLPIKIVENNSYDGISVCDLCVVASGTATIETAILKKPMVIIYKTSPFSYFLAKRLIKIPWIGMVNVVRQKTIVPELIQNNASPEKIALTVEGLYRNEEKMRDMISELERVRQVLGAPGASRRAAEIILKII